MTDWRDVAKEFGWTCTGEPIVMQMESPDPVMGVQLMAEEISWLRAKLKIAVDALDYYTHPIISFDSKTELCHEFESATTGPIDDTFADRIETMERCELGFHAKLALLQIRDTEIK